MRLFFSIFLAALSLDASADYTLRLFAIGTSHTDASGNPPDDGSYAIHNDSYVVFKASDVPLSWGHSYVGQQTILAGVQNSNPPPYTPFAGVRYIQSYAVYGDKESQVPQDDLGVALTQPPVVIDGNFDFSNVGRKDNGNVSGGSGDDEPIIVQTEDPEGGKYFIIIEKDSDGSGYDVTDMYTGQHQNMDVIPVYFTDSDGNVVQGYYNPSDNTFSTTPPNQSGDGSSITNINLAPIIANQSIQIQNQNLLRQQLIDFLGTHGSSWVYDCKLSLDQLAQLASSTYPEVVWIKEICAQIADKNFSPTVNVEAPVVNVDVSGVQDSIASQTRDLGNTIMSVKTSVDGVEGAIRDTQQDIQRTLDDIDSKLAQLAEGEDITVPSLPAPDLSADGLNDAFPLDDSDFNANAVEVNSTISSWVGSGTAGPNLRVMFSGLKDYLSTFIGSIPSVGSDSRLFSVDFDLPFIGHIHREYSWDDFPYIQSFRSAMVFFCYVFFGIASFKMIHRSFI